MKILLLLFWLLIITPLYAQAEENYLYSLSLEELAEVTITGSTLTPKILKTVPSAVTVFTHKEIKRMGLDSLDELMNLVPGFQSYRSSESGMSIPFSSRGRRIASSGAEILLLVDGQRLDDPRTSGNANVLTKYPLMHIERVEFIRGPGSAVYGSNAMMGVINIVTRSNENELQVSYGSFDRKQVSLLASHQIGDATVDLFGRFDTDDGDDYHVQDTFSPNRIATDDPRELANLNVKLRWHDTQINFQHTQGETENFYVIGRLANDFNEASIQLDSISLQQGFDWLSVNSWVWLGYRQSSLELAAQLTPPGALAAISNPPSNDPLLIIPEFEDYSEIRAQWHNDWAINAQSSLQFGVEYRHIDAPEALNKNNFDLGDLANGNFPIPFYGALLPTTVVQTESRRDIVGVYAQYQHTLFEKTHLTLGLRYDSFSGIGSRLSPRVGLVQELGDHHSLKLLYGEAFRAPAEQELNLANNPVFLGNPDLKPETVQSWEAIWVGQWPDTGFSLGYFENHFEDSIVQMPIGGGVSQVSNIDQDPSKGIEFEFSHQLNEHWLLRGTYTHFTGQPESSFRETDRLGSLMVNFQQGKWNANLIGTWAGEREMPTGGSESNRITLDDYWQVFGKLRYNFAPDWHGFVQVKNLLDEDFETPSVVTTSLTEGIPNRGREILAGIIWQF